MATAPVLPEPTEHTGSVMTVTLIKAGNIERGIHTFGGVYPTISHQEDSETCQVDGNATQKR